MPVTHQTRRFLLSAALLLLSTSSIAATATPSATPAQPANQERMWNLNNADIRTLVQQVSKETGKNFVIDPRVQAKVTMISAHPLSPDELYQTFLGVLQIYGFSAVEEGKIVKIIPIADARFSSTKFAYSNQKTAGEEFVTKVIHADTIPARDIEATLKSMVGRNSYVSVYQPTNDIIISDSASNIARIEKMLRQIDRPSQSGTQMIRLKYASAAEVARTLQDLEGNRPEYKANPVSIAVDERTNSLLISGGESRRVQINSIIARLDIQTDSNNNTQVIYLKFIRAQDIAPIIASLIQNYIAQDVSEAKELQAGGQGGSPSGGGGVSQPRTDLVNRAQTTIPSDTSSLYRSRSTGSSSTGMQGGASTSGTGSSSLTSRFDQNKNFTLPDDNRQRSGSASNAVQWEETTNSIIVKAPPALMRTIYSIISKLDIRRPQVLVEAIVAEVSMDRAQELGVEWNTGGSVPFGTRFPSESNLTTYGSSALRTGEPSSIGSGITIGFFKGTNLRAIVRALAGDSTTNILATPNIVTLDNEIATIKVGQLVPFAIAQTNNQNTGGNPLTSFDREEVGLSLTIRPQITNSGAIRMYIEHILSSIVAGSAASNAGGNPTTTERVISTNVLVDHTQILVLGGLIQKQWTDTVNKVPVMGDLPLVGELFRSRHKELVKTNLMIFLKPVILRDASESFSISNEKYSSIRGEQLDTDRVSDRPFRNESPVADNLDAPKLLPPPFPVSGAPRLPVK